MRELIEISAAFEALCREGKPSALATVVRVEGSSYRRPGARMLIAEDGRTWGGVSGGCLERDVARRGLGAMASGKSSIARYDTAEDEQLAGGVSTGCGGAIEVFIQPLSASDLGPMGHLAEVLRSRKSVGLVTVIRSAGKAAEWVGRSLSREELIDGPCDWPFELRATAIERLDELNSCDSFNRVAQNRMNNASAETRIVTSEMAAPRRMSQEVQGQACPKSAAFFIETIHAPQHLVIFGAGPDVVPVVGMAKMLGWRVTVVGSHPATQIFQRFPTADSLHVTDSNDPSAGVEITPESAVLVVTHNIARDAAVLRSLLTRPRYLGVLGPRHRTERVLSEWPMIVSEAEVFSPVGLDLGAETPDEIALSIVAEIQKSLRGATGQSLRERRWIHDNIPVAPPTQAPPQLHSGIEMLSCKI